ncbi:hypothetical protein KC19_1G090900 [Ceratodon purpureus]|uniref:Uncharacterized protein n=1 Tax=Ceratodon purpureus TaxID=3225 RepID=A0A8T0J6A5_CERPU|nr:hypothetical protein KC19_1G090900 [Ceratodon purpureus]
MALMMMRMAVVGGRGVLCSLHCLSASPSRFVSALARPGQRIVGARPGLKGWQASQRVAVARAGNDEPGGAEVDVSVFRFTLGIPGFDDADLPRLVGVFFGSLLLINHAVSIESMTNAQLTSEVLGLFLAAVACSLPSVGRRLKGGEAGKEGNKGPGRRSVFELARRLSGKQKQELAWGTFALLQNTKTSAVIVWHRGEVVGARGSLGLEGGVQALPQLQKMLNDSPVISSSGPLYVSNGADTKGWPIVPKDAKSILVQPFEGEDGGLILLSYQPRSYSSKDRTWVTMLAEKFSQAFKT